MSAVLLHDTLRRRQLYRNALQSVVDRELLVRRSLIQGDHSSSVAVLNRGVDRPLSLCVGERTCGVALRPRII